MRQAAVFSRRATNPPLSFTNETNTPLSLTNKGRGEVGQVSSQGAVEAVATNYEIRDRRSFHAHSKEEWNGDADELLAERDSVAYAKALARATSHWQTGVIKEFTTKWHFSNNCKDETIL